MTSPRLPLVKAQQSFLSGIRLSREQHGPKVKVTVPPKNKCLKGSQIGQIEKKSCIVGGVREKKGYFKSKIFLIDNFCGQK